MLVPLPGFTLFYKMTIELKSPQCVSVLLDLHSPEPDNRFWPEMDAAESGPVTSALMTQDICLHWQDEQLELVHREMLQAASCFYCQFTLSNPF